MWVDIRDIDNKTPFMRVRWKSVFANDGDRWFSEMSGLTTDDMVWTNGTSEYGWFSAHRMNQRNYSCSFDFDRTQSKYWDVTGQNYRVSMKDGVKSRYYDSVVSMFGLAYYDVDFSLWSGASGYQLYAPYADISSKFAAGDVYVYIEGTIITPKSLNFDATGGTGTTTVNTDSNWVASYSADTWFVISPTAGTSGVTSVNITVNANQSTTTPRKVNIDFIDTNTSESIGNIVIKQKRVKSTPDYGVFLGGIDIDGLYLGSDAVQGIYLGDKKICDLRPKFDVVPDTIVLDENSGTTEITITSPESGIIHTDSDWISFFPWNFGSGTTVVPLTYTELTGSSRSTVLTAITDISHETKTITITQQGSGGTPYLDVDGSAHIETSFNPRRAYNFGLQRGMIVELAAVGNGMTGWGCQLYKVDMAMAPFTLNNIGGPDYPYQGTGEIAYNNFNTDSNGHPISNPLRLEFNDTGMVTVGVFYGQTYQTSFNFSDNDLADGNLVFFAQGEADMLKIRFYHLKVWTWNDMTMQYDNLAYHIVPESSGTLQDLVSGTVYQKTGTGFTTYGVE